MIIVYRNNSMCAASLKNGGPSLIGHYFGQWLVKRKYSPEIVRTMFDSDQGKDVKC